jgi:hypothetical protein
VASSASSVLSRPASRRDRLLGSEFPRIFTPPLRELTEETTLGFDAIAFAEQVCGIRLYPWQRWLLKASLELDPALTVSTMHKRGRLDPLFRFRKVIVLVARQNGKSTLSQVLALFFMYQLGTGLVLGTAQDLDTAEEVWDGALEIIEETPDLAELAAKPVKAAGKKAIVLKTGERYKVKAANRRAGRGLSGDLILLDELREHQSWDAWGAITKTTMARPAAQIWALSNAGDVTSVVLRYLRKQAHAALGDPDGLNANDDPASLLPSESELSGLTDLAEDAPLDLEPEDLVEDVDSLGIFEWSAPPMCDVHDRAGWAAANPSLGHGISERTLAGDAAGDPEWIFRTECLCQWSDATIEGPFPPGSWDAGQETTSGLASDAPVGLCVDVSWDRSWSHIALSGTREDGSTWVEVVASRPGTHWLVDWLTSSDRQARVRTAPVALQAAGAPVSSLADSLREAGVNVVEWKGSDLATATGGFYDAVKDGTVRHGPWPALDIAAATAVPKMLEGGAFWWDRKRSPVDVSPLIAATGAAWLARIREPDYDLLESVR